MGVIVLVLLALELFVVPLVSASVNGARQAKHKALKAPLYTEITDDTLGITDWVLSGRYQDYQKRHQKDKPSCVFLNKKDMRLINVET